MILKLEKTDITKNKLSIQLTGFVFNVPNQYKKTSGALITPADAAVTENNAGAFSLRPSWKVVSNADFYEIKFNNLLYTHINDTAFSFDGLQPETSYNFQLRAVNKMGYSNWVNVAKTTRPNPLQFAIKGMVVHCSAPDEEGYEISKLTDLDESDDWHTSYGQKVVPFDIVVDMKSFNQLDKLQYLPRTGGRNGILTKADIYYSDNNRNWVLADSIKWSLNNKIKEFIFTTHPTARYIKLHVSQAGGDYGSGRELYIFKVPGSPSYIPGDINNDGKIDNNDLTSYTNYTGLRKGDGDFEGYISNGDINKNNLIDAFDISNVATQLDGGINIETDSAATCGGSISITADKKLYKQDEFIEVLIKGENFKNVNAFSFALPYDPQYYEYIGTQLLNIKQMENLTYDRLHTNGTKALYPTFVNIGDKETLTGTSDLFILKFKAKRDLKFDLKPVDGVLVSKTLNAISF